MCGNSDIKMPSYDEGDSGANNGQLQVVFHTSKVVESMGHHVSDFFDYPDEQTDVDHDHACIDGKTRVDAAKPTQFA